MRRRIVERKSGTNETELKTMRKSKNYARVSATENEAAKEKEIWLPKRRSGAYKNRFEETKITRRECI